jgi:hypothetical protein
LDKAGVTPENWLREFADMRAKDVAQAVGTAISQASGLILRADEGASYRKDCQDGNRILIANSKTNPILVGER